MKSTMARISSVILLLTSCIAESLAAVYQWQNYYMSHCTESQASQVISVFRDYETALPSILHEANLGLQSAYGFQSFFSVSENQVAVTSIFTQIKDTALITLPSGNSHSIVFFCINQGDPTTVGAYNMWLEDTRRTAAALRGTYEIWLLPSFWHHKPGPPALFDCPTVHGNKVLAGTDELRGSMWLILVHELVEKYLHELFSDSPSDYPDYPEVYTMQECIDLPADKQVWNAQNYALFAAGIFTFQIGIWFWLIIPSRKGTVSQTAESMKVSSPCGY